MFIGREAELAFLVDYYNMPVAPLVGRLFCAIYQREQTGCTKNGTSVLVFIV